VLTTGNFWKRRQGFLVDRREDEKTLGGNIYLTKINPTPNRAGIKEHPS